MVGRRPLISLLVLGLVVATSCEAESGTKASASTSRAPQVSAVPTGARTVVAAAGRTEGGGWAVSAAGDVRAFGDAPWFGQPRSTPASPLVAMGATPDGRGYWLATQSGRVYAYGDAHLYPLRAARDTHPALVVAMAPTPDGRGYWLATQSGRVYAYGDAHLYPLRAARDTHPALVVAMAPTPDGRGYWLTTAGGYVSAYGDARLFSPISFGKANPGAVVAIASTDPHGYWLATAGGTVYPYGDAASYRPASAHTAQGPAVIAVVATTGGYYLVNANDAWDLFGSPSTAPVVRVVGNRLVSQAGRTVRLIGVDASGTSYSCVESRYFSWDPSTATEAGAIASWGADVVRVPLNEDCWLGINGAPLDYPAAIYREDVIQWVQAINDAGMVAILDLHLSAPGSTLADEQWPMADADHSITFWSQVASTFRDDPSVIFDLFNEPFIGYNRAGQL